MRILFIVPTMDWDLQAADYNGGGWADALIRTVQENGHSIAVAFCCSRKGMAPSHGEVDMYPIQSGEPGHFGKFLRYHGGYKRENYNHLLQPLIEAVNDSHPEVIYLFGFENPLAVILGHTRVPVLVHIQGLLGPYSRAFLPKGIQLRDFYHPFSVREWIYRNGYVFCYKQIRHRGSSEPSLISRARYVTGRTDWDRREVMQYALGAKYYHIGEILRPVFYQNAGTAVYRAIPEGEPIRLISTISETAYKGLDVIMKAAAWLQKEGLSFRWQIAGVGEGAFLRKVFERALGIQVCRLPLEFLGCLSADELAHALTDSDLYIHPSYIDNSPNSLCEAQMIGLPVVATCVGGVPSLVEDQVTGWLVPSGDGSEIGKAVKKSLDAAVRERLGKAALNTATSRHDRKKIAEDLIKAFREIVNSQDV